jgi:hypothetical protein
MISPAARRAARAKLAQLHGVHLSGRHGTVAIARAIARALFLPSPKSVGDASEVIRSFLGRSSSGPVATGAAARPFVPLSISPAMAIALARTREAMEAGTSSTGSTEEKVARKGKAL